MKHGAMVAGISAVLTSLITDVIYHALDFSYSVFDDGFNLLFLVDIGTFITIYLALWYVITKFIVKVD